jgi:hypothetical protein
MRRFELEQLESRRLLSVGMPYHPHVSNPSEAAILAADNEEVDSASNQLSADQAVQQAQSTADAAAVAAAKKAALKGTPQKAQLQADEAAAAATLAADQAAVNADATYSPPAPSPVNGSFIVRSSFFDVFAEIPSPPINPTTNNELSGSTQNTQQSALAAANSKLSADQTSTQQTIANDKAAVQTILQATPAYTSAVARQQSDAASDAAIVAVDTAISNAASNQLQSDSNQFFNSESEEVTGLEILEGTPYSASTLTLLEQQLSQSLNFPDTAAAYGAIASAKKSILASKRRAEKLQARLWADQAAAALTISNDNAAVTSAAQSGVPAVITAEEQIAADQNNSYWLSPDQSALSSAQADLRGAVNSAEQKLTSDQTSTQNQIAGDQAALTSFLNAQPAYAAAEAQLKAALSAS